MAKRLDDLELSFAFWDAVDGRQSLPENFEKYADRPLAHSRLYREISDAEIACSLSHLQLYQKISESNFAGAIILEDDAIIGDAFKKFVQNQCYKGKNFVQLGHENARVSKSCEEQVFEHYSFRRLNWPANLTVAYYLTSEIAEKISRECMPVSYVADWGCDTTLFGALVVDPPIVGHILANPKFSSLENDRKNLLVKARWQRFKRFTKLHYWKKVYYKIISVKLPGSSTINGDM